MSSFSCGGSWTTTILLPVDIRSRKFRMCLTPPIEIPMHIICARIKVKRWRSKITIKVITREAGHMRFQSQIMWKWWDQHESEEKKRNHEKLLQLVAAHSLIILVNRCLFTYCKWFNDFLWLYYDFMTSLFLKKNISNSKKLIFQYFNKKIYSKSKRRSIQVISLPAEHQSTCIFEVSANKKQPTTLCDDGFVFL